MVLSDRSWIQLQEQIYHELISRGYIDSHYKLYGHSFNSYFIDFSYELEDSLTIVYEDYNGELNSYDIEIYKL